MVGVQKRYALRDDAKEKVGDAMRCKQCGSSDVIPVVSGSPSDVGFRAEMLGLVRFGGVSTGMLPIWYCSSCRMEFSSDDAEGHEMATNNAIEAASRAGNEWLDSHNAQEIAMGRQVYERLISDFRLVGATAVRLSSEERSPQSSRVNTNRWNGHSLFTESKCCRHCRWGRAIHQHIASPYWNRRWRSHSDIAEQGEQR